MALAATSGDCTGTAATRLSSATRRSGRRAWSSLGALGRGPRPRSRRALWTRPAGRRLAAQNALHLSRGGRALRHGAHRFVPAALYSRDEGVAARRPVARALFERCRARHPVIHAVAEMWLVLHRVRSLCSCLSPRTLTTFAARAKMLMTLRTNV